MVLTCAPLAVTLTEVSLSSCRSFHIDHAASLPYIMEKVSLDEESLERRCRSIQHEAGLQETTWGRSD